MTFSNKSVARVVNKNFVCAWKNLQPGYDWQAGLNKTFSSKAACRRIGEGHSDTNIVTTFLTPTGEVLHALPGYWYPKRFLQETKFVLQLRKAVLDKKLALRKDRKTRFEQLHKKHEQAHSRKAKGKVRGKGNKPRKGPAGFGSVPASLKHGRSEPELQKLLAASHRQRAGAWGQSIADFDRAFRSKQIADFLRQRP